MAEGAKEKATREMNESKRETGRKDEPASACVCEGGRGEVQVEEERAKVQVFLRPVWAQPTRACVCMFVVFLGTIFCGPSEKR